jgi:hypothetical protein
VTIVQTAEFDLDVPPWMAHDADFMARRYAENGDAEWTTQPETLSQLSTEKLTIVEVKAPSVPAVVNSQPSSSMPSSMKYRAGQSLWHRLRGTSPTD